MLWVHWSQPRSLSTPVSPEAGIVSSLEPYAIEEEEEEEANRYTLLVSNVEKWHAQTGQERQVCFSNDTMTASSIQEQGERSGVGWGRGMGMQQVVAAAEHRSKKSIRKVRKQATNPR